MCFLKQCLSLKLPLWPTYSIEMQFKFPPKCILQFTQRGKQTVEKMKKGNKPSQKSLPGDLLLSLPPEILFDILSRLPIKSLMKCKSLCKDWYHLITSPGFVQLHLKHAKENKQKILLASSKSGITSLHSSDYETLNEPMFNYNSRLPRDLVIVGTSNGLVCLSDYKTMIVICNPATKKHLLKLFDKFDVLPENHEEVFCLGFGHDPVGDEYKVMRVDFSYHKNAEGDLYTEKTQVFVYTLGTESWREIQLCFPLDRGLPILPYASGALHVFERMADCRLKDHQIVWAIVSFDLRSEDFRRLSRIPDEDGGLNIGVLQGCLSVSFGKDFEDTSVIWLMKKYGVMESWTKVYSISTLNISHSIVPLAVRKDNVVLLQPWVSKTSIYHMIQQAPRLMSTGLLLVIGAVLMHTLKACCQFLKRRKNPVVEEEESTPIFLSYVI